MLVFLLCSGPSMTSLVPLCRYTCYVTASETARRELVAAWNLNCMLYTMHFTGFYKPGQPMKFSQPRPPSFSPSLTPLRFHSSKRRNILGLTKQCIAEGWSKSMDINMFFPDFLLFQHSLFITPQCA
jgi:hypothetical protein